MPSATHTTNPQDSGATTTSPSSTSLSSTASDSTTTALDEISASASNPSADNPDPLETLRSLVLEDTRAYIKRNFDESSLTAFEKSLANAPSTLHQDEMVDTLTYTMIIDPGHIGDDPSFESYLSHANSRAELWSYLVRGVRGKTNDTERSRGLLQRTSVWLDEGRDQADTARAAKLRQGRTRADDGRNDADEEHTSASRPDTDTQDSSELEALRTRVRYYGPSFFGSVLRNDGHVAYPH